MGRKIAIIGAGSIVFCKTLVNDILAAGSMADSEIVLMNRTEPKLRRMESFFQKIVQENHLQAKIWGTLDRQEAIRKADFVVVLIQVGGVRAFEQDYKIPLKWGVEQCIGDSLGPGGVFRGLRTIPVLLDIARDIEKLANPKAIMLLYSNPMSCNCFALGKTSKVSFVGLCHSVQSTLDLIACYCQVPKEEITYTCGGINHMDWFLTLEHRGRDLYPILREAFEKPEYYKNEKVRAEVFRNFGYFMTESSGHLSEYVPWFRKNKEAIDLYCDVSGFGGKTGAYYNWCKTISDKYAACDHLEYESAKIEKRSKEYGSYIMEATVSGKPFRFVGNVKNEDLISNLPKECCVEVPVFIDGTGLHPQKIGSLPSQCAAACLTNINVQTLAAEAAIETDTEKIVQALALDPLTGAVCTLNEIREMCIEILETEREWLPNFEGKKIQKHPFISIPKDIKPVEIPLDPELAIGHRFGKLLKQDTSNVVGFDYCGRTIKKTD